jgi:transcriptional regulator with XRE-family HTH domain
MRFTHKIQKDFLCVFRTTGYSENMETLKNMLKLQGITKTQLARRLHVCSSTVSRIVCGEIRLSAWNALEIAAVTDTKAVFQPTGKFRGQFLFEVKPDSHRPVNATGQKRERARGIPTPRKKREMPLACSTR